MDLVLPALILVAFVAAWVYLPFAPAVRELQERTDVEPVKVVSESAVDVHYFANNYRRFIDQHLAWPLARCREEGVNQYGRLDEGIPYAGGHRVGSTGATGRHGPLQRHARLRPRTTTSGCAWPGGTKSASSLSPWW